MNIDSKNIGFNKNVIDKNGVILTLKDTKFLENNDSDNDILINDKILEEEKSKFNNNLKKISKNNYLEYDEFDIKNKYLSYEENLKYNTNNNNFVFNKDDLIDISEKDKIEVKNNNIKDFDSNINFNIKKNNYENILNKNNKSITNNSFLKLNNTNINNKIDIQENKEEDFIEIKNILVDSTNAKNNNCNLTNIEYNNSDIPNELLVDNNEYENLERSTYLAMKYFNEKGLLNNNIDLEYQLIGKNNDYKLQKKNNLDNGIYYRNKEGKILSKKETYRQISRTVHKTKANEKKIINKKLKDSKIKHKLYSNNKSKIEQLLEAHKANNNEIYMTLN